MKRAIRHPAYPVEELAGLLFAYLGPPETQPLLPRWDILVREAGQRELEIHEHLNCNWLQGEENTADVTHTYFLHAHTFKMQGRPEMGAFFGRPMAQYGFQPFEWGRWLNFPPLKAGQVAQPETIIMHEPPWTNEQGEYTMDSFASQDTMAWETQGPIFDRTKEHLGASDRGLVIFRAMLKEQIELVQRGGEPMAWATDPALQDIVDMRLWLTESDFDLGAAPAKEVFDERHEVIEVLFGKARPVPAPAGRS